MKILSKLIVFLFVCIVVAMLLVISTGHVIIFVNKYRLDLSLTTLIVFIAVLFISLYTVLRLWAGITSIGGKLSGWKNNRKHLKQQKYFNEMLVDYFAGKFSLVCKKALKNLKLASDSETKFIILIVLYVASNYSRDEVNIQKSTQQLQQYSDSKCDIVKLMAKVKWLNFAQEHASCVGILEQIIKIDKNNIAANRYLLESHLKLGNYSKATDILRWFIKNNLITDNSANIYTLQINQEENL